jgi:hypothetical protein
MVQGTRYTPSSFGVSGSEQPQQPPPPPNMAKIMAAQTELLRQLVQGQQAFQKFQQQWGGHNVHQPQAASYLDFLDTQPPLFHKTEVSDPGLRDCVHNIVHTGLEDRTCPIPYLCCTLLACEVG